MFTFPTSPTTRRWASIALRLVIGFGFVAHGWAKFTRGPAAFAGLLHFAGVPYPLLSAWLITLLEIFGGLAIIAGAFVGLVSIPLILSMIGAVITVQGHYGFSSVNTIGLTPSGPVFGPPGYEINLLYIAGLIALMLAGPGALSVDSWLARRRHSPRPHVATARTNSPGTL
jgi:putative oxidoreductase